MYARHTTNEHGNFVDLEVDVPEHWQGRGPERIEHLDTSVLGEQMKNDLDALLDDVQCADAESQGGYYDSLYRVVKTLLATAGKQGG